MDGNVALSPALIEELHFLLGFSSRPIRPSIRFVLDFNEAIRIVELEIENLLLLLLV